MQAISSHFNKATKSQREAKLVLGWYLQSQGTVAYTVMISCLQILSLWICLMSTTDQGMCIHLIRLDNFSNTHNSNRKKTTTSRISPVQPLCLSELGTLTLDWLSSLSSNKKTFSCSHTWNSNLQVNKCLSSSKCRKCMELTCRHRTSWWPI